MAQARRVHKVAAKVREVLAMELLGRAEPRFSLMTITSVVVSPDLRIAKVYWSAPGDVKLDREDVLEAIEEHTPSLRKTLAKKLGLRAVPYLKFFFDETMDKVEEVERLFQRVRAEDKARNAAAEVASAGLADAGLADAGLADAGLADAGLADAGLADTGLDSDAEDTSGAAHRRGPK